MRTRWLCWSLVALSLFPCLYLFTWPKKSPKPLPRVLPTGPASDLYWQHLEWTNDYKVLLSGNTLVTDSLLSDQFRNIQKAAAYVEAWDTRVNTFRKAAADLGLYQPRSGEVQTVDVGLVTAFPATRLNTTWMFMESLIMQKVKPKELGIVVVETKGSEKEVYEYLSVLLTRYVPLLENTDIKLFSANGQHFPNDNRWYGFNQTKTSIVSFFDADDFMMPNFVDFIHTSFEKRPELDFALIQYGPGDIEAPSYYPGIYDERILEQINKHDLKSFESLLTYDNREYEQLRKSIPDFGKDWWLGNTDAEPNWKGNGDQKWWDGGCHNGWATFRRNVIETVPPPTKLYGGEDAIFNFRVIKAGFNYRCFHHAFGIYLKCFCGPGRHRPLRDQDLVHPGRDLMPEKSKTDMADKLGEVVHRLEGVLKNVEGHEKFPKNEEIGKLLGAVLRSPNQEVKEKLKGQEAEENGIQEVIEIPETQEVVKEAAQEIEGKIVGANEIADEEANEIADEEANEIADEEANEIADEVANDDVNEIDAADKA